MQRNTKSMMSDIPLGRRQLFFDDHGIADIKRLTRTMHQPAKKGAVIRPDLARGETSLQTRSAPAWDPEAGLYKLWMLTSTDIPGGTGTTYAESEDGLHWRKPIVQQVDVGGSLDNNFVTVDPTRKWPENAMENVVYDPGESDPSRRYKGLAQAFIREPVVSPDGIHWCKLDVPPIPSQDESNLSYDPVTRTFLATVKHGGPHGRSVHLATSTDFESWTAPELIFHADDLDQSLGRRNIAARLADPRRQSLLCPPDPLCFNVDVYNMGVFRYEGLYVGLPAMYHAVGPSPEETNTFGFHIIQLTCSRNLKTWQRLGDRQPFIAASPVDSGAYDLTQILPPSAPVVRGDELWFYYTGLKYRAPWRPGMDRDGGAICLATLRRDGFVSLDAGKQPGSFITRPFKLPGAKLLVNGDTDDDGTLSVEALDESGESLANSAELTGDQPHGEVTWMNDKLADLQNRPIRLRFTLRNGRCYSYWFEA